MTTTAVGTRIGNPARLDALARTGLLDAPVDPRFQRITRLATALLHAPVSLVTLVAADRQFFAASDGLPEALSAVRSTPLDISFCAHVVAADELVAIEDTTSDPRTQDNPAVAMLGVRSYAGVPLRATDGQALGTLCVADDRQRAWTVDELSVLQDLAGLACTEVTLSEVEHARTTRPDDADLVASLAHDVRGMVSAISGGARTLARAEQLDDEQRQRLAGIVHRQADALHELMTQFLDSEAIDGGRVALQVTATDVGALLADVVASYRLAGNARVRVVVGGQLEALADPLHLRRCLNNLVDNALRHGGEDVAVEVVGHAVAGGVRLTVTDDGVGVRPEDQARIFARANQCRRGGTGYGLGLYVVRRLVEGMGGTVGLVSEPGRGSTFTIELPTA